MTVRHRRVTETLTLAAVHWRRMGVVCCVFAFTACGGKESAIPDAADEKGKPAVKADSATADAKDGEKPGADAKDAGQSATPASKATVAASVATVSAESFTESINASGVVTARTGHFASLSAPAPTRITAVNVTLGAHVKRGTKLVSFETTTFDAAASSADAALNAAQQTEARARRLVDAGVAPRKDIEAATAEVAAARSASVNARRAQQLAILESPIDGVVTRLSAVLGANVDMGQSLIEISDTQALDVQLVLSPAVATKIHSGQSVKFRDGSSSEASAVATGKVADVAAALDSATRGVIVRVAIGNQKRTLRIGESLYGQIAAQTHAQALVIPDDALVPTGEGFQVFVVDDGGKAHARPVTIGARDNHRVWISDGLKAGETIVTTGAFGMDDGATVVTRKTPAP